MKNQPSPAEVQGFQSFSGQPCHPSLRLLPWFTCLFGQLVELTQPLLVLVPHLIQTDHPAALGCSPAMMGAPNYFYKVVLLPTTNSSGVVTDAQTVGFWFENKTYSGTTYSTYSVSVDQIEEWTGFDFFPNLPDSVEAAAEVSTTNFL